MIECEGFLNVPYFLGGNFGDDEMRGSYAQGETRLGCMGRRIA
jgi:hypothetical protein